MAGNIVDLIEEIRLRLATAQASGNLTEIKRIRVGTLEEARKENDYPIINLNLGEGAEEPVFIPAGNVTLLSISVTLLHSKLAGTNTLYKTSDQTGALYVLEKMLNTIDKNVAGNRDMSFNSKGNNLKRMRFTVDSSNAILELGVILEIETKQFIFGGR